MAATVHPADSQLEVIWEPRSKPQAALISCPVFEVFFGGSRGSLKTDSVLGDWINHAALYGELAMGLMIRRTREDLASTFERAKQLFTRLGFKFSGHRCTSPNGAKLFFAYLDKDSDADNYQGWNLTRVYVEEIGQFPNEAPILKLMATLRSTAGVPVGFRATGNPGGAGHQWVKARYINACPSGWVVQRHDYVNPFTGETVAKERVFIPGRITDHDLLGADYIAQLQMQGSEELVRAWLLGDWDAIEGAFFDCWDSTKHVIKPFPIPETWLRFRSMDWGFARPFSVGWWAISDGEPVEALGGRVFPRGAMIRYREWYGCTGQPNVGVRLYAEEVAAILKEKEAGEKVSYGVADPAMFSQDGGPSIAERMMREDVMFRRGDNARVQRGGHMGGWDQMRGRLVGADGVPMLYAFATCTDSIRTIPALQHDPDKPEDLDTDAEDHAADEWRYACMSRPWVKDVPKIERPKHVWVGQPDGTIQSTLTIGQLIKRQEKRRKNAL